MNDEGALARRPRHDLVSRPSESSPEFGRPAPRFVLVAELEELPHGRIEAFTLEDELRMRSSFLSTSARRRLHQALDDVLDELLEEAA